MTDIAINHDLLAKKKQLYHELNDKIEKIRKNKADLVKIRDELKEQLALVLLNATTSEIVITELKKNISQLDTKIDKKEFMYHKLCDESQDTYLDINEIKSALNITSDDDEEDDDPTLFGIKIRGVNEFCNNPETIANLIRIVDPAVLERIMER